MPCDLNDNVTNGADSARMIRLECRWRAREALIGDLIVRVGLFTGDVIGPDAHGGWDSIQSSAERARRRFLQVILMRYRESGIRHETRATGDR
jgi:hypothetical protein